MTLAQVVYQISSDGAFAAQMRSDPISALAQRGFQLSREELASLLTVLKRDMEDLFDLDSLVKKVTPWS
jgi:hypothetical protein